MLVRIKISNYPLFKFSFCAPFFPHSLLHMQGRKSWSRGNSARFLPNSVIFWCYAWTSSLWKVKLFYPMLYVDFHRYYFLSTKQIYLLKPCNCLKSYECPDQRLPELRPWKRKNYLLCTPHLLIPSWSAAYLGYMYKGKRQSLVKNFEFPIGIHIKCLSKSAKLVGLGFFPPDLSGTQRRWLEFYLTKEMWKKSSKHIPKAHSFRIRFDRAHINYKVHTAHKTVRNFNKHLICWVRTRISSTKYYMHGIS